MLDYSLVFTKHKSLCCACKTPPNRSIKFVRGLSGDSMVLAMLQLSCDLIGLAGFFCCGVIFALNVCNSLMICICVVLQIVAIAIVVTTIRLCGATVFFSSA